MAFCKKSIFSSPLHLSQDWATGCISCANLVRSHNPLHAHTPTKMWQRIIRPIHFYGLGVLLPLMLDDPLTILLNASKQTGSTHTFTSIDWPIPWQWLFDSLPTDDFLQHICKVLLGVASRMRLQYPVLNEKDLKCMNFLHSLPHLEKIGPTSCVMISCSLYVICKTLYEIHKGLNIVWYVE